METTIVSKLSFGSEIMQLEPLLSTSHIPQSVLTNNASPYVSSTTPSSSPAMYTVDPLGSSPSTYPSVWEPAFSPINAPSISMVPSDGSQQVWSSSSTSPTQDGMRSSTLLPGDENKLNANASMDQSTSSFFGSTILCYSVPPCPCTTP